MSINELLVRTIDKMFKLLYDSWSKAPVLSVFLIINTNLTEYVCGLYVCFDHNSHSTRMIFLICIRYFTIYYSYICYFIISE